MNVLAITTEVIVVDRKGKVLTRTRTKRKRQILPNVEAGKFWLINRQNWSRDSERTRADNKGAILEALDRLIDEDDGKGTEGDNKE